MDYDLIIMGGGPGGYLAAERAAAAGLQTLLVEKAKLGGVCLNEGCIPSKALLHSAKILRQAQDSQRYGVQVENASIDLKAAMRRKDKVVRKLVAGVRQKMKENGVTVLTGKASLQSRTKGLIHVQVDESVYSAAKVILATGSEVMVPPIPGLKEGLAAGSVWTSREVLSLTQVPDRVNVIGGGVIGLELASILSACGSQVHVIELLPQIAAPADPDLAQALQKILQNKGLKFSLDSRVTAVESGTVTYDSGGEQKTAAGDATLLSAGRKPVIEGIGLENLGVYCQHGHVVTDSRGQTNIPGLFAVGDVNGRWLLAHAAYREAEVAVATILGRNDRMHYDAMPSVLYTQPELAFVGETEVTCRKQGIDYDVVSVPLPYSGRHVAEHDENEGLIKLIVRKQDQRLIGCHLLSSYASEIIVSVGLMIERKMRVEDVQKMIFPHPTIGEIIREAVFQLGTAKS